MRRGPGGDDRFRGWARPGPEPPGAIAPQEELAGSSAEAPGGGEAESLDAHCGRWKIFQLARGHRFSTDDLLAAWWGTLHAPHAARVLDLGSGIGSVALTAAFRLPGARIVTLEAQAASARLAKKSFDYNGLADRVEVREGDLRDEKALAGAGLFGLILGAPPYFPPGTATAADHAQADAARIERRGDASDYAAAAARHLAPGGLFACVHLAARVADVEGAMRAAGIVPLHRRSVVFREGEPARIALFAATLARDLPDDFPSRPDLPLVHPPLVVRQRDGRHTTEYALVRLALGFPPGEL